MRSKTDTYWYNNIKGILDGKLSKKRKHAFIKSEFLSSATDERLWRFETLLTHCKQAFSNKRDVFLKAAKMDEIHIMEAILLHHCKPDRKSIEDGLNLALQNGSDRAVALILTNPNISTNCVTYQTLKIARSRGHQMSLAIANHVRVTGKRPKKYNFKPAARFAGNFKTKKCF